jgi:hypothetical protein
MISALDVLIKVSKITDIILKLLILDIFICLCIEVKLVNVDVSVKLTFP